MKIDFSTVIFTDKSQETFDRPDVWPKGWILSDSDMPVAKRRQEGVSSVMIWVEIIDQRIIGPFKVDETVKLNSAVLWTGLSFHGTRPSFKVKCVFMHNNVPFHVSNLTCELCEHKREKIMKCHHQVLIWIWSKIYGQLQKCNYMKVANNITAKQTYEKLLILPCQKLNLLK